MYQPCSFLQGIYLTVPEAVSFIQTYLYSSDVFVPSHQIQYIDCTCEYVYAHVYLCMGGASGN